MYNQQHRKVSDRNITFDQMRIEATIIKDSSLKGEVLAKLSNATIYQQQLLSAVTQYKAACNKIGWAFQTTLLEKAGRLANAPNQLCPFEDTPEALLNWYLGGSYSFDVGYKYCDLIDQFDVPRFLSRNVVDLLIDLDMVAMASFMKQLGTLSPHDFKLVKLIFDHVYNRNMGSYYQSEEDVSVIFMKQGNHSF